MAEIRSIDVKNDEILLNMKITTSEYVILKSSTKDIIVLPTDSSVLTDTLTTGKLGNGNRIMMPNKLLKRASIPELKKKVPSKIFNICDEKYLLIKLADNNANIPVFRFEE